MRSTHALSVAYASVLAVLHSPNVVSKSRRISWPRDQFGINSTCSRLLPRRFLMDARLLNREPWIAGVNAAFQARDAAWVALRRHHHLFDFRVGFRRRA